ncbi:TetR/AcrR family transcriptional regulator [Leucobacter sp. W1153]|uniref:TetR/AcrR family transcriptional regulator n=1 Tax=Leucobacter sp. W1153 TaxID=3439064 RepID=UPI003F2A6804
MQQRTPLSRANIVQAAAQAADNGGLAGVSMRRVGRELGVEAMSLYHHVANKDELLDALVDWVFAQIELPTPNDDWRAGMVRRAASARAVLTAHPWALGLIESRANPGPSLLTHHDAVIGCLRRGGFPVMLASHAFSVIDAYVYGFALTEQNLPFDPSASEAAGDFASEFMPLIKQYPHLAELVTALTSGRDYVFTDEFSYGLEVILDELERRLAAAPPSL